MTVRSHRLRFRGSGWRLVQGPEEEGAGSIPLGEDRACPVSGPRSVTGVDSDTPVEGSDPQLPTRAVVQRLSRRIPVEPYLLESEMPCAEERRLL